ncbi:hypothetical protein ACROYT_G016629 [Oculina patagonica]
MKCCGSRVQTASFAKELEFLQSKRGTFPPVYVTQFNLFLNDQQIIRCKGRVSNAPLSEESKNPILLPSKHPLTNLIIQDVHSKIKHSGIKDTLTTIRERFWVPRGREAVKRILRKCVTCRRVEGAPYRPPPTPDLPMERVSLDPPFAHTGLDFIGPLYIHNGKSSKEKGSDKVYICLFTCASTRAIHLELTPSLSVESFLLAFRRFVNRQGLPVTLLSDNAKTFRSASKDIRKIIQSDEVMRYLTDNRIPWNFIIERAPWWGGFWERMVKVVKQPLKKTVGRTTLNYDELQTIMVEIQAIVNARPLTYVYDDEESISTPLTPSHLITGRRITYEPSNQHFQVVSVNQTLTKRAKHHQRLLQQFTKRWQHEYLLSLRERANERCKKQNKENPISVGDIVISQLAALMDNLSQYAFKTQTVCGCIHFLVFVVSWPIVIGFLNDFLGKDRLTFNCVPKPDDVTKQLCYGDYTSTVSPLLIPLNFAGITFGALGLFWIVFIVYGAWALRRIKREENSQLKKCLSEKFTWRFLIHVCCQLVVLGVMMGLFCHFQTLSLPEVYICSPRNTTQIPMNQGKNMTCNDLHYRQKSILNIGIITIMAISIVFCTISIIHLFLTRKDFLEQLVGDPESDDFERINLDASADGYSSASSSDREETEHIKAEVKKILHIRH